MPFSCNQLSETCQDNILLFCQDYDTAKSLREQSAFACQLQDFPTVSTRPDIFFYIFNSDCFHIFDISNATNVQLIFEKSTENKIFAFHFSHILLPLRYGGFDCTTIWMIIDGFPYPTTLKFSLHPPFRKTTCYLMASLFVRQQKSDKICQIMP